MGLDLAPVLLPNATAGGRWIFIYGGGGGGVGVSDLLGGSCDKASSILGYNKRSPYFGQWPRSAENPLTVLSQGSTWALLKSLLSTVSRH